MIIELAKKKSFETRRATKEKAISILETTKDKIHEILNFQNSSLVVAHIGGSDNQKVKDHCL